MPLTPHNRPPAHNLTHNTFFIRHRSRHTWHEPDYPPTQPQAVSVPSSATAALNAALSGFPTLLLTTLSATLVTPHEADLVSTHPDHFSPEILYTQLGKRNSIALINLLAQRLRVELVRLPLPLPTTMHEKESTMRQMRRHWTNLYLTSQRDILACNIEVLDAGLLSALNPGIDDEVPELFTLSTAFQMLRVLNQDVCEAALGDIAVVYGIEYSGGREERKIGTGIGNGDIAALVSQVREMEVEEDVWVLWIGLVVFILQTYDRSGDGGGDGARVEFIERLRKWTFFLAQAYGVIIPHEGEEMDVDDDDDDEEGVEEEDVEEDVTTHILSVLAALRTNSTNIETNNSTSDSESPSASYRLWSKHSWTPQFVTACAAVVQMETINLRVEGDSALRNLEGVQGDPVALVGLYVGCEMRSVQT